MNIYYVYCLLDPTLKCNYTFNNVSIEYEPFYIGKGSKNRIEEHFSNAQLKRDKNKSKVNKIIKIRNLGYEPIRYKIYENLNENEALEKEKELISILGRKDLDNGRLTNLTNGGEYCVHWNDLNKITQTKMIKSRKERMINNNPMKNSEIAEKSGKLRKGIIHSDEYKINMSESVKKSNKHKISTSTKKFKEALRKAQEKNMKPIIQYDKNMIFISEHESISSAARQLNINKKDISSNLHQRQKTVKGYIFKFKDNNLC